MQTPSGPSANHSTFRIYSAKSLGSAIGHYRRELDLSQAELAERAGLNRTYLSELEGGRETEQVRRILRLLNQLGVRMVLEKADW